MKSKAIVVASLVLFAMFFVVALPRINPPDPQVNSYLIAPGGVSRAIVQAKSSRRGRGKRLSPPFLPHHLDFESSLGPIDVYVLRFSFSEGRQAIDEMMTLTDELAAGRPPETFVAKASGERGRIELGGWWPYGWTGYLVLVRSEKESEVKLVTHYGP